MGKSTASCFKIISCGGSHSVDHEDLQTPKSKGSSDRHGWSFRMRSVRHRSLSNNGISEAPASASKENPESTAVNFQVQPDLTVPEKSSDVQWAEEKTELPIHQESKLSEEGSKLSEEKTELTIYLDSKLAEEKTEVSTHLDSALSAEKTELSTQLDSEISQEKTEVSAHLDSKLSVENTELPTHLDSKLLEEKTKSTHLDFKSLDKQASREDEITKLDEPSIIVIQAAIRGSLAQQVMLKQKNIIKLQAVVRGHIVRRHAVGTLRCVQAIIKMQALVRARHAHFLIKGSADPANQRDRSGQKKKIAQSTGTYTNVSIEKLLSNAFARQLMEATPKTKPINIKCDPLKSDSVWKWLERWVSVSSIIKEEVSNEELQKCGSDAEQHNKSLVHSVHNKENFLVPTISKSTDTESGADAGDSLTSYDMNDLQTFKKTDQINLGCDVTETAPTMLRETDLVEIVEVTHLPEMGETENDRNLTDMKMPSAQQPETVVKKISRKASNPAFIAAQSKFEELSLGATSAKLSTSSSHDPGVESSLDKVSSSTDQPFSSKDSRLAENGISNAPAVERGGSECGTELFISSALDSPNSSEAGVNDGNMEIKAYDGNHPISRENLELEGNSIVVETDHINKLERDESVNFVPGESLKPTMDNIEKDSSHLNKSSPEASPRSHATISEFQATPSSQVSVKPKKRKGEKSGSDRKIRRSSADKNISNHSQDSSPRSSLEQHKSGKRRNSRNSVKPDHREQEPRDSSSSSNTLPSYMQATQSAKAKAIANASPRSSPDVHDKDIYIKKRHSLPGISERQGSPRMHRSLSQVQQNATHSPQDRMWRR